MGWANLADWVMFPPNGSSLTEDRSVCMCLKQPFPCAVKTGWLPRLSSLPLGAGKRHLFWFRRPRDLYQHKATSCQTHLLFSRISSWSSSCLTCLFLYYFFCNWKLAFYPGSLRKQTCRLVLPFCAREPLSAVCFQVTWDQIGALLSHCGWIFPKLCCAEGGGGGGKRENSAALVSWSALCWAPE